MNKHNYLQSILSYFTTLDIDNLRLYLKDEYSYQDTTKEIFLNEIASIFEAHKDLGDTELIIYKGECGGKLCENCGKKGFRFVGNRSGNYIDLLFETEGDDIKDIYECCQFMAEVEIECLGIKADIYIQRDDQVTFHKTPEYWSKVVAANRAWSEIITTPVRLMDFKDLSYWIDKHVISNDLIGDYTIFNSPMRWSDFSELYSDLKLIRKYLSNQLNDIIEANYLISLPKSEQGMIDWILKYESIYNEAPFDLRYQFFKEGENYLFKRNGQILFRGEEFIETLSFIDFYRKNHKELMDKFNTYSLEEEFRESNYQAWSDNKQAHLNSLRFHLENRKAMEEIGITIPFYINKKNDLFDLD